MTNPNTLYFIRAWLPRFDLIERSDAHLATGLGLVAVGLALGAVHHSFSAGSLARVRKGVGIALASAGLLIAIGYFDARPMHVGWEDDLVAAREKAKQNASPLLIDFGASWCQACGELERHTFSHPSVIEEGRRFVKVKVDLSPGKDVERGKAWLQGYGARGLPLVVVHHSDGDEAARITEFVEAEKMLEILRAVN